MVDHVIRIISGQKLYISPSLEFVPLLYTPLYFYLAAVLSKVIGIGFTPLRIISFISSLGSFFIIFIMTKRETNSTYIGLLASSLFAATYQKGGAWLDIARVDSLFLFLLLISLYFVKFYDSRKSYILASIFISLSFLTKQTALNLYLAISIYYVFLSGRRSLFFITPGAIIIGISTVLLNYIHEGWYTYYVFKVPSCAPIIKGMLIHFWTKDLLSPLCFACSIAIFYIIVQILNSHKKNWAFYMLALTGMVGGAWLSRLRGGGYDNVLMPAYAIISILFGLGIHAAFQFIRHYQGYRLSIMEICMYTICIAQFAVLLYNPFEQIPEKEDLEAGKNFINLIAQIEGDILVTNHGFLPVLAGKKSFFHEASIMDLFYDTHSPTVAQFKNQLSKALQEKKFSAIIIDYRWPNSFPPEALKYYTLQGKLINVFITFTGWRMGPSFIYTPKKE
ncbi:MAG: glycosyltransferase family 39 protein [Proteobacteria bacterium]|nr:glycosyltransferase family 39 protein [Pseudomonadota bacterium]